jgi:hypothetical protein
MLAEQLKTRHPPYTTASIRAELMTAGLVSLSSLAVLVSLSQSQGERSLQSASSATNRSV